MVQADLHARMLSSHAAYVKFADYAKRAEGQEAKAALEIALRLEIYYYAAKAEWEASQSKVKSVHRVAEFVRMLTLEGATCSGPRAVERLTQLSCLAEQAQGTLEAYCIKSGTAEDRAKETSRIWNYYLTNSRLPYFQFCAKV